jgi:uncharacterized C2H2 Zn-finger protein
MDFKCYYPSCNRVYKSRQNLRRHVNTDHLKVTQYLCSVCGRFLSSKKNLVYHTNKHWKLESVKIIKRENQQMTEDQLIVKPLILSNHFKDQLEFFQHNNCYPKVQTFLPPIDSSRQSISSTIKLKLIPSLLDFSGKTFT